MSAVLDLPQTAKPNLGGNGQRARTRRFSVKEYDAMIEHGILTANDQVELLNGEIICKMPKGTKHSKVNDRIHRFFGRVLDDNFVIRNQNPIWLNEASEPEPDLVIALADPEDYEDRHPTPADILLIVEISDSTLRLDRNTKALAYAQAGLQQYLIFNVPDRVVEDYRDPSPSGYRTKQTYAPGQSFSLVAFPEITINATDLLPSK